jgi:hypothetical protein
MEPRAPGGIDATFSKLGRYQSMRDGAPSLSRTVPIRTLEAEPAANMRPV